MMYVKCYRGCGVYSDVVTTPERQSEREEIIVAVWKIKEKQIKTIQLSSGNAKSNFYWDKDKGIISTPDLHFEA